MIAERGRGRGGVAGVLSSLQGRCRRSRRGGRILPRDAPKVTDSARFPSPSRDSVTSRKAGAARVAEGDGFCHEVSQGRRIPAGFRLPRVLSRHPDGGAAARLPEGDASCRETARGRQDPPAFFSFGRFRDKPSGQLPRGCPRGTLLAARLLEGDRTHLLSSPSDASVTSRPDSCRETAQRGRILPRGIPRVTDSARFPSPSRALAALAAQPASHAPLARKRPASKGGPPTQNYARVLELTGSARRRGKKKCKRRTRCTRPR